MSDPGPKEVAKIVSMAGGEIIGSTRLQKISCLLDLVGAGVGFEFSYHLYGPYSEELSLAAADAKALDLICITEKVASWGGKYLIYQTKRNSAESSEINALATRAAQADSVVLELAVTAAFLAKKNHDDAWGEVSNRKRAKATPEMMKQAKSLYSEFQKINVPTPLPLM